MTSSITPGVSDAIQAEARRLLAAVEGVKPHEMRKCAGRDGDEWVLGAFCAVQMPALWEAWSRCANYSVGQASAAEAVIDELTRLAGAIGTDNDPRLKRTPQVAAAMAYSDKIAAKAIEAIAEDMRQTEARSRHFKQQRNAVGVDDRPDGDTHLTANGLRMTVFPDGSLRAVHHTNGVMSVEHAPLLRVAADIMERNHDMTKQSVQEKALIRARRERDKAQAEVERLERLVGA